MIGVQYTYNNPIEIIKSIQILQDFGVLEYLILGFLILLFVALTFYIFPTIHIYIEDWKIQQVKIKRKIFIRQIALQKDIEDEIERELKIK